MKRRRCGDVPEHVAPLVEPLGNIRDPPARRGLANTTAAGLPAVLSARSTQIMRYVPEPADDRASVDEGLLTGERDIAFPEAFARLRVSDRALAGWSWPIPGRATTGSRLPSTFDRERRSHTRRALSSGCAPSWATRVRQRGDALTAP